MVAGLICLAAHPAVWNNGIAGQAFGNGQITIPFQSVSKIHPLSVAD
jgi:hypothetical protein